MRHHFRVEQVVYGLVIRHVSRMLNFCHGDLMMPQETNLVNLIAKFGGRAIAQAFLAFRRRHDYDVILTDGEHIGIPLAVLLKLARARVEHAAHGRAARVGRLGVHVRDDGTVIQINGTFEIQ